MLLAYFSILVNNNYGLHARKPEIMVAKSAIFIFVAMENCPMLMQGQQVEMCYVGVEQSKTTLKKTMDQEHFDVLRVAIYSKTAWPVLWDIYWGRDHFTHNVKSCMGTEGDIYVLQFDTKNLKMVHDHVVCHTYHVATLACTSRICLYPHLSLALCSYTLVPCRLLASLGLRISVPKLILDRFSPQPID